jgi:hypothetical protein
VRLHSDRFAALRSGHFRLLTEFSRRPPPTERRGTLRAPRRRIGPACTICEIPVGPATRWSCAARTVVDEPDREGRSSPGVWGVVHVIGGNDRHAKLPTGHQFSNTLRPNIIRLPASSNAQLLAAPLPARLVVSAVHRSTRRDEGDTTSAHDRGLSPKERSRPSRDIARHTARPPDTSLQLPHPCPLNLPPTEPTKVPGTGNKSAGSARGPHHPSATTEMRGLSDRTTSSTDRRAPAGKHGGSFRRTHITDAPSNTLQTWMVSPIARQ